MKFRRVLVLSMLAAIFAAAPASASLVFYRDINISGTGHGTVTEILGFPNLSHTGTQSGCVKWTTTGNDAFGGECPTSTDTFGNDQITNGGSASQTVRVGDVLVGMTPFTLGIAFDPSEGSAIQVERLVLTFYNPNNPLGVLEYTTHSLSTPQLFPDGGTGSGGSGFVFGLDWDQAVEVQQWVLAQGLTFSDVRLGLGAELTQADSHSYFFIANVDNLVQTPEPLSFVLVGFGLAAVGLLRRKRA